VGRWQRNKGANFERKIANEFKRVGIAARRSGGIQAQAATVAGDVTLEDLPGLWIECKKGAKTYPLKALRQAKEACRNGTAIAVCQDDREEITVTMDWTLFVDLLTKTYPDIVKTALALETEQQPLHETSDE
jgi:hypothetical protein